MYSIRLLPLILTEILTRIDHGAVDMPLPLIADILFKGIDSVPFVYPILKTVPWLMALFLTKLWFGGASNKSERLMHSKVIMITVT